MNEMRKLMEAISSIEEAPAPRKTNTALKIFRQLLGPGRSYRHPHGGTIKMQTSLEMKEIVNRVKTWAQNNPDKVESFDIVKDTNKRRLELVLVEGYGSPLEMNAGAEIETHWNFRKLVVEYYPELPGQIFAAVRII